MSAIQQYAALTGAVMIACFINFAAVGMLVDFWSRPNPGWLIRAAVTAFALAVACVDVALLSLLGGPK